MHELFVNKASSSSSSGIPPNFLHFLNKKKVRILFSSNGLLLCKITRQRKPQEVELFICNPTTKTYSSIATPPGLLENPHRLSFAFGYNHNNKGVDDHGEYQLILLEYNEDQEGSEYFVCKGYMPREGVWKEREKSSFMGQKLYYHGAPFKKYILTYNFESGETRRVLYPKEVVQNGFDGRKFFKWDKVRGSNMDMDEICLVVLEMDDLVFTFWLLTDHKSSSWSRFLTLNLKEMGLDRFSLIYEFAILNGNSFVFATTGYVYRYDLIGGRENKLERICEHNGEHSLRLEFISYSNTLCSCGADAKGLPSFLSRKRRRN
ncbi:uncharacterized protein LOC114757638 [Neltuma alba]|uniref:uncharacterized protein LOC114757638 n=1 Tax=Neltuma alba TaxID=207710 RepID=UPI0010A37FAC|nr:uncharacterized protein LOC114757638 [Prosopis alba]